MGELAITENGDLVQTSENEGASAVGIVPVEGGLKVPRRWTSPGRNPFDQVKWETRKATITNEKGEVVFEQENVEVPSFWSQMATNVVVSKYFRGKVGTPGREKSVRDLIGRVVRTLHEWGTKQGYFATEEDGQAFEDELAAILLTQKASFNSPVWFNLGVEEHPQCSACFINSVQDTMESILNLAKIEGMLFKYGSGTGTNFSTLRSSKEHVTGGGTASGPVSFMKGYDAFAGVIKSGGKTRRAAKMVILNIDHPDIVEFINCKVTEEKKAWALIEQGYDGSFNGEAYSSVFFQNSNNSVRVTDEFMVAVEKDLPWNTRAVVTGEIMDTYRARDLMRMIAEGTYNCGDPGMQFHSTVNKWHTCPVTGPINASNPCSEFMFLDNSACNLASLNLLGFQRSDGVFDVDGFRHAVNIIFLAQEIIVDNGSYPTNPIQVRSYEFRPLGLGYANLGALLMSVGLPYDSDAGRAYAATITALMTGEAYSTSAKIARRMGTFKHYEANKEPMLNVIGMHKDALKNVSKDRVPDSLYKAAEAAWERAQTLGREYGFRNAQTTLLAPTGTIAFMMDCDTTGIEPDIALVKYKKLVGGGLLKIVNQTVPRALKRLGYSSEQIKEIIAHIDAKDTIEGAPHLKEEHLPVFDCAFRPANGKRSIDCMGHLRMMSAVQPFLSGAISKTVNMPNEATVEDIMKTYIEGWKLGLKSVAIYRDGCKRTQPLNTSLADRKDRSGFPAAQPYRRRLPDTRKAITHKFSVGGHEGYLTVGMYEDGKPGEIFLTMSKEGSVVSGLVDCFATAISMTLQYGVPLPVLVQKFSHMRFEPSGWTSNPRIRVAKSIIDYIFRWLASEFLSPEECERLGILSDNKNGSGKADDEENGFGSSSPGAVALTSTISSESVTFQTQDDAPPCAECGAIMVRSGTCYKCLNCGATSGCS